MTKNLKLGSYSYYLYTEIEDGKIFGCWLCDSTEEKGESSKACDTEEDAIALAELHANANYNINHKKMDG